MLYTLSVWTHSSVNWLMFVFYANDCRLFVFVLFNVYVFVGAIEIQSQLLVGACCVCKCFICLLKVNNLQVYFYFCVFGACVSVLLWDLRVLLDVLCFPINLSFIATCYVYVYIRGTIWLGADLMLTRPKRNPVIIEVSGYFYARFTDSWITGAIVLGRLIKYNITGIERICGDVDNLLERDLCNWTCMHRSTVAVQDR